MERLTETKFDREMRIGFAMIDRHFDDAIVKLDALKKEYERKLAPKPSDLLAQIHAAMGQISGSMGSYGNQISAMKRPYDSAFNEGLQNMAAQRPIYQNSLYGMPFFINPGLSRHEIRIVP